VFAGRYRPSTFFTLALDSHGWVDGDRAAVDPDHYDYRRAARDAIHFPALLDRFWQNTRRCVGWDVQYFGHLGIAGRRVLVSRKWSNKTQEDHRAERDEFVRQLLQQAGIQPAHRPNDGTLPVGTHRTHRP
jgi:hypothetical protein